MSEPGTASHRNSNDLLWRTFYINYHQTKKDALLMDFTVPACENLKEQGMIQAYFIQRHWLHGPHLRLHLGFQNKEVQESLKKSLSHDALKYLAKHPSTQSLDEQTYLNTYRKVAEVEVCSDPLLPLFTDNSVGWSSFAFREHMYGNAAAASVAIDFFSETQSLCNDLLSATKDRRQLRFLYLINLLLVFVCAFRNSRVPESDPIKVSISLRSHTEAYLYALGPERSSALRTRLTMVFDEHKALLLSNTKEVLEGDFPYGLAPWHHVFCRIYPWLFCELQGKRLRLLSNTELRHFAHKLRPESALIKQRRSPLHKDLDDPTSELYKRSQQAQNQGRRFLINLVYDRFLLLGMRPVDRLFLCFMAAQTIEHYYFGRPRITGNELVMTSGSQA